LPGRGDCFGGGKREGEGGKKIPVVHPKCVRKEIHEEPALNVKQKDWSVSKEGRERKRHGGVIQITCKEECHIDQKQGGEYYRGKGEVEWVQQKVGRLGK